MRKPIDPGIATWEGDTLLIDGVPMKGGGLPRAEYWAGRHIYLIGPPRWSDLVRRYLKRGDTVAGPHEGQIASASVKLGRAGVGWTIHDYEAWGLPALDLQGAGRLLSELYREIQDQGMEWTGTAAGTARAGMAGLCPPEEVIAAPPRWAECSRGTWGAMTQGPQWVGIAECERATTVDRKAAYLQELRGPLPRMGGHRVLPQWRAARGRPLPQAVADLLRPGGVGVLSGVVLAPYPRGSSPGSLPIRLAGKRPLAWVARYPGDEVAAGTWSAPVLRAAIADGAELREVYGGWISGDTSPWCEIFAEWVDGLSSHLRRLLYTRGWGALASSGWAQGEVGADKRPGGMIQCFSADKAVSWWTPEARYTIDRPDAASQIAGRNTEEVFRVIRAYSGSDIVSVSVDAVTVKDGAHYVPSGWVIKRDGGGRFWAPGWYDHAGTSARSGRPPWVLEDTIPSDMSSSPCRWSYPGHPGPSVPSGGSARSAWAVASPCGPGEAMAPDGAWDTVLIPPLPGDTLWGTAGYALAGGRAAPLPRLAGERSEAPMRREGK